MGTTSSMTAGGPGDGAGSERLRIVVDRAACQGHARCVANVPELFDLDDQGIAIALKPVVDSEADLDALELAVNGCPEQALSYVKETT